MAEKISRAELIEICISQAVKDHGLHHAFERALVCHPNSKVPVFRYRPTKHIAKHQYPPDVVSKVAFLLDAYMSEYYDSWELDDETVKKWLNTVKEPGWSLAELIFPGLYNWQRPVIPDNDLWERVFGAPMEQE